MTEITPITDSARMTRDKADRYVVLYANERNGVAVPPGVPTRIHTGARIATDTNMAALLVATSNLDVLGVRLVSPTAILPGQEVEIVLTVHNHSSFVANVPDGAPVAMAIPLAAGKFIGPDKAAVDPAAAINKPASPPEAPAAPQKHVDPATGSTKPASRPQMHSNALQRGRKGRGGPQA